MNKKRLALMLSKLGTFEEQDVKLEQYPTDPDIAADMLWFANMQGDIKGKIIADLGCGHGIFGLGALALGAKKVLFVDIDSKAIDVAKKNKGLFEKELKIKLNAVFFNCNVRDFNKKADLVLQNPPFGVKTTHMDKLFLLKAMETALVIYSFHKLSTEEFIKRLVKDNGFGIVKKLKYRFPLKKSYWFHFKRVHFVNVGCWKIVKIR